MDKVFKNTILSKEFIDKLKEKQKLEGKMMNTERKPTQLNSEVMAKLKALAEKQRKEGKTRQLTELKGNSKLMQIVKEAQARQKLRAEKMAAEKAAVEKAVPEKVAEIKGEEITDPVKENPEKAGE